MARIVKTPSGGKIYFDDKGEWHREDGPAYIDRNGWLSYSVNGKPLSIDGNPTDYYADGSVTYFNDDIVQHTTDYPASSPTGLKRRFDKGKVIWPKL